MIGNPDRGLPPSRLEEIERAATECREQGRADVLSMGMDASDVFALAIAVAGLTEPCPNLAHEGRRLAGQLDCTGAIPVIRYEAYDPLPRRRFSVAHELGHLVLHERRRIERAFHCGQGGVDPEVDTDVAVTDEEAEANAFAAAFLMPRAQLEDDVEHFGECVSFLAQRYGVSRRAMELRLSTLGVRTA